MYSDKIINITCSCFHISTKNWLTNLINIKHLGKLCCILGCHRNCRRPPSWLVSHYSPYIDYFSHSRNILLAKPSTFIIYDLTFTFCLVTILYRNEQNGLKQNHSIIVMLWLSGLMLYQFLLQSVIMLMHRNNIHRDFLCFRLAAILEVTLNSVQYLLG